MLDPRERLDDTGCISTGVDRARVPRRYEPLISALLEATALTGTGVGADDGADAGVDADVEAGVDAGVGVDVSVYLYGSVATGTAMSPDSDVDVLLIGCDRRAAVRIGRALSTNFAALTRQVEVVAASPDDVTAEGDEGYGLRVFLHHYCLHLAGPARDRATAPFPGDRRAARGFNGDIAEHLDRWRADADRSNPDVLGRTVARKTLLAVAGLVSIRHGIWTTDRARAARLWSRDHPDLAADAGQLLAWATDAASADRGALATALAGVVAVVSGQFADEIGLWNAARPPS